MRRWLPWAGIVAGVAIATYGLFFSDSEEDEIRELLDDLEEAVAVREDEKNLLLRAARVKGDFAEIFDKDVHFEIPEMTETVSGRPALVELAAAAPQLWRTAVVDLDGLAIEVDQGKTSAVASGDATLVATRHSGELERDKRTVSLRIDKIEGDWRIVSLSVSPKGGLEAE
jgi:phosphoribosylformylglycinamidine synthase